MLPVLTKLELHVTHTCNLRCVGCSHFSDVTTGGNLQPGDLTSQLAPWLRRLQVAEFTLLGGEPFVNLSLAAICQEARGLLPVATIWLVTNGLLVGRQPDLPEVLKRCGIGLIVTIHSMSLDYQRRMAEPHRLLAGWRRDGVSVQYRDGITNWAQRYRSSVDGPLPFSLGDPQVSYSNCASANCKQLYEGKLWKCPLVTYRSLLPNADAWPISATYKPLAVNCSEVELTEFLGRGAESVCGQCPSASLPLLKQFRDC